MRRSLVAALFATALAVPTAQASTASTARPSIAPRTGPLVQVVNDPHWINKPELGAWMLEHNVRRVVDVPKDVLLQWRVPTAEWTHFTPDFDRTWSEMDKLYLAIANGFEPTDRELVRMGFKPGAFWGIRKPVSNKFGSETKVVK